MNVATQAAIQARLQQAAMKLQAGDAVAALAEIDKILAVAPGDVEALHLRAMALGRAGRIDEASAAFEAAANAHPRKDAVLMNFGNALKRAGRIQEARVAYERATRAAPQSSDAFNALGLACREAGDVAAARAAFETALRLNPQNAMALNNLGLVEASANRHAEAVDLLTRAIAAAPRMASAYINRGASSRTLGHSEAAIRDHLHAATLAPQHPDGAFQLAASLRQAGRTSEADSAFRRALELDPARADIHRDYAKFLFEMGAGDRQFEALDRAIGATRSPRLMAERAELSLLGGDAASAAHFSGLAIAADPSCAAAYEIAARADRVSGDFAKGRSAAMKAAALAPDDFTLIHTAAEFDLAAGAIGEALARLDRPAPRAHRQKHIALKSVALRLAGNDAYHALYDFERFARQIAITPPPGFVTIEAFNEALATSIKRLHISAARPVDQTLFGGTQSVGRLWNDPDPVIGLYVEAMKKAAADYVAGLPDDEAHPFLAAKGGALDCAGAWSVILASGGGHVDHIHPAGWVSASYYVSAPDEIFAGERAGYLRLGASGVPGVALPAERYFAPIPGTVVFFPSYIWHGVEPFEAVAARITAPFDLSSAAS